jgi:anti-anti-sigma regulatory factor
MELIERKNEKYAVVFNVNLLRATLIEATEFRDLLEETVVSSDKDVIVNLSACEHLDSTFLGVLVSCYKRLKSRNRTLVLIEPVDQSSIFLTLNSIGKIFPLYTNVKVALEDIENKKLLEKEINELEDQTVRPVEKLSRVRDEINMRPETDSSITPITEETGASVIPSEQQVLGTEIIYDKSISEDNVSNEHGFSLIEHDEGRKNIEEKFFPMSEESSETPNDSKFVKEETKKEELKHQSHHVVIHERKFNGGKVEWEFGFSG